MDLIEAQLIIDILKTGSKYFKATDPEIEDEGFFIEYCQESDEFIVRRYESDDWAMHNSGYDRTCRISEQELLKHFTQYGNDHFWWPLYHSNSYSFDFDQKKPRKTRGQKIREQMDPQDLSSLRCSHCNSRTVEPLYYSTSLNPGEAKRYVELKVCCNICHKESDYSWDD